ncbi:MAG: SDR family oxidoreductase [Geminicoccaceae bacterium]
MPPWITARGMAYELAADGITVNVIAPGATLTDFNREHLSDPKARARREAAIPMGRLGDRRSQCAVEVMAPIGRRNALRVAERVLLGYISGHPRTAPWPIQSLRSAPIMPASS